MSDFQEYQFNVKVEGYRETTALSQGNSIEEAKESLIENLNSSGFMDIQYVI